MKLSGLVFLLALTVACYAAPTPQWLYAPYGYAYAPYSYYTRGYISPYYTVNTLGYGYAAPYTYYI